MPGETRSAQNEVSRPMLSMYLLSYCDKQAHNYAKSTRNNVRYFILFYSFYHFVKNMAIVVTLRSDTNTQPIYNIQFKGYLKKI